MFRGADGAGFQEIKRLEVDILILGRKEQVTQYKGRNMNQTRTSASLRYFRDMKRNDGKRSRTDLSASRRAARGCT